MPLPLIPFIFAAGVKIAAAMKTAAIAKAGAVAIAKGVGGKAVLTKGVVFASQSYGLGTTVAVGAIASISVGAAILIYKRAEALKSAIVRNDIGGAVRAATALVNEMSCHGGLDGASSLLHQFISSSGSNMEIAKKTSQMLDDLLHILKTKVA